MPAEFVGVVASARSRTAGGNCDLRSCRTRRGAIAGLTNGRARGDRAEKILGIFVHVCLYCYECVRWREVLPGASSQACEIVPEDASTFSPRLAPRGHRVEFGIGFRRPLIGLFPINRTFPGLGRVHRRKC